MYRGHVHYLEMASASNIWFVPNTAAGRDVYLAGISPALSLLTFSFSELKQKIPRVYETSLVFRVTEC